MHADRSPAVANRWQITAQMLEAGYAVIGEFDPDITCLTSETAVYALLKAVYVAMCEAAQGADVGDAIQAGVAFWPNPQD